VRIFVCPDSEKNRVTKTIVSRPLSEFHLADDYRFNPFAPLHFGSSQTLIPTAPTSCRDVEKRTLLDLDFGQLSMKIVQELITEAGSNSA
jgi:hypothetical protein